MRLISCYIANFGGLSDCTFRFDPGLTTVMEPNGFGKTTLAEFIRAMFYGFPRAGRALEKNRRKKYLPWQGGRYGGNLVFEQEGVLYRIERFFGERPSADTFALYDLRTNRRSFRFSQDIGLELFQLDADSFERSTYFPQLHADISSLTTDSIQAKLGNLVEDTNDVNNFEAAKTALQRKRSSFIPYRGQGGLAAQAQSRISELDERINEARGEIAILHASRSRLMEEKEALQRKTEARDNIQGRIRLASQAAGRRAVVERYEQLSREFARDCGREAQLSEKYPHGFPAAEQVEKAIADVQAVELLKVRLEYSPEYLMARRRLDADTRFASGVPSEETIRHYQELCASCSETRANLSSARLSGEDVDSLEALERLFANGVPGEEMISQCREARGAMTEAKAALRQAVMPSDEAARLARLERLFAHGVPSDDAIADNKQKLEKARYLREENQRITVAAAAPVMEQETPAKKGSGFLAVLILGILSLIGGAGFLLARFYVAAGCLAGLGLILLIVFWGLRLQNKINHVALESRRAAPAMGEQERSRLRENDENIRRLESEAAAFLDQYTESAGAPGERLQELQNKASDFRYLRGKERDVEEQRHALEQQIAAQTQLLTKLLSPYYGDDIPDDAEADLTVRCRQYADLTERRDAAAGKAEDLTDRLRKLNDDISAFLEPYVGEIAPEDFAFQLNSLQKSCNDYARDKKLVADQDSLRRQNEEKLRGYQNSLAAFSGEYALPPGLTRGVLEEIQSDIQEYAKLRKEHEEKKAGLDAFCRENESILSTSASDEQYDLDSLKEAEDRLTEDINTIAGDITKREHEIGRLQEDVDGIPAWEDEQAAWRARYEEARKNAGLLDSAVEYLEKARESLSTSYLAPIRQAFTGYLQRFTRENGEDVYIAPTLDVTMDRSGKARELEYFSTGQTDTVMLCMRLALVDALFKDEPVFVILDDPFVNLDDERTAAATALLKEIAQDRQIIYLVCNSSRSIS